MSRPIPARPSQQLRFLEDCLPGLAAARRGRIELALALAGAHLSGILVALLGWGAWIGTLGLLAAASAHVVALSHGLRLRVYPPHPHATGAAWSLVVVGAGVYAPIAAAGYWWARPATVDGREVYLVNRAETPDNRFLPVAGDWIWIDAPRDREPSRPAPPRTAGLHRVLAPPGRPVALDLDNRPAPDPLPRDDDSPLPSTPGIRFRVPDDHLLVLPVPPADHPEQTRPPLLVPLHCVSGRAWLRAHPLWRRARLRPDQPILPDLQRSDTRSVPLVENQTADRPSVVR